MKGVSVENKSREPDIRQFGPHIGVELGFALAAADEALESRTKREADEATTELIESMKQWPKGTRERLYVNTLRLAAVGLSHGLTTRVKTLVDVVTTKKRLYDEQMQEFVNSPIKGSLITIGYRLLMMFGFGTFVYVSARLLFSLPQMQRETHVDVNTGQPQWASLAFAVGFALLGAFVKAWMSGRTVKKLTKEFEDDCKAARELFLGQAREQYEICADTCTAAWKALTNEEAPTTKAFERLLSTAMANCHGDISRLLFDQDKEPDPSIWKRLTGWMRWKKKKPAKDKPTVGPADDSAATAS